MSELLKNTAIVALIGVIIGAVLTGGINLLIAWVTRNRDFNLKLWERFLDHRITAHEAVVSLALKMRFMCPLGTVQAGEVVRAPQVMMSKDAFENWFAEFSVTSAPATTWLSSPVKKELNFVQDYFVTLHTSLSEVSSERFPMVGALIRQDFIDLSSSLEQKAFQFFEVEARKRRLDDLKEHHKYPLEETTNRLHKTMLLARWPDVQKIIQTGQSPT